MKAFFLERRGRSLGELEVTVFSFWTRVLCRSGEKVVSSHLCLLLRALSFVVRSGGLKPTTVIGNVLENLRFKELQELSFTSSGVTQDEPFLNVERTFLLYYFGVIFIIKTKSHTENSLQNYSVSPF